MGWFSDLVDSFTGGGSSSSSSSGGGYEEAAYGGSKVDYYNNLDSSGGEDSSSGGGTYTPAPVDPYAGYSDAYRQYAQSMDSAGLTNLSGAGGAVDLFQTSGGDVTDASTVNPFIQSYQTQSERIGDEFNPQNVIALGDYATGDFAGGDFANQAAYVTDDDLAASLFNFMAPRAFGAIAGPVVGSGLFNAGASAPVAGTAATLADQGLKGYLSSNKIAQTVMLPDGTIGYKTNFAGKEGFTTKEAVTQRNIELAQQLEEDSGSDDVAQSISAGLGTAVAAGNTGTVRGSSWRDYYRGTSISPDDLVKDFITGSLTASDYKAAQLAGRLGAGEELVPAAFNVYGDAINDILPEGYEQPTEAAIRIGLGENRVSVFGDVYGEDFNLDNPLGKAGLEGAEVFDKTGDANQALGKAVYTYYKEGGELPEFEAPEFLGDINLDINLPRLQGFGFDISEAFDALPSVPWRDISGIDISIGDIDWPKVEAPEGGYDWNELTDKFPDLNLNNLPEGLDIGNIDLGSLNIDIQGLSQAVGTGGVAIGDDDEFQSLESDFEINTPDSTLARTLIETAIPQEKS